jgi:hypothetical protein
MAVTRKETFFKRTEFFKLVKQATLIKQALLGASLLALCSDAFAGPVIPKPGTPGVQSSEFGSAVARFSNYTAVGAMQETVAIPNEPIIGGNPIGGQGVVYLFNGTSANPERRYQFAGNNHFFKRAGARVAISNKWLAFAATEGSSDNGTPSRVYIVGKTNNQWTQCPSVNGLVDCTSSVKVNGTAGNQPILSIDFPGYVDLDQFALAISDDYLVMGNQKTSELLIYRYDAIQKKWLREFAVNDHDPYNLGRAVAIDGDMIAVSGPAQLSGAPSDYGIVRIYKRNSSGTWNIASTVQGSFIGAGDGGFGRTMDMHAGKLVVGSGLDYNLDFSEGQHSLTFYSVNSLGELTYVDNIQLNSPHKQLALHGDTAVVSTVNLDQILTVYKRNASTNTWSQTAAMNGRLYISPATGLPYPASDPMDLIGDDLVLGWRAHNKNNGAIIHEKISQIDVCKSTLNLVANCSFDNSGSGWQFLNHQGASSWGNFSGGQLTVTTYNPGSVHWHIQARTAVNLNEGGTYQLQFRAKADNFRDVTVNIGHNGNQDNNWQSYGQTLFRPGPEWTQYIYEFYGVPSDANAFLDFNFGNAGTTGITIDGISLAPLEL